MSLIWESGQFAWPIVVLAVYGTACVIGLDYAWRVTKLPAKRLALYGALLFAVGAAAIVALPSALAGP